MAQQFAGFAHLCIMNRTQTLFIFFIALILAISGCKKDDMVYYIKSNPQELHFSKDGGLDTVAITSNSGWTVIIPLEWCKTNLSSVGTSDKTVFLRFQVEQNTTTQSRSQDVVIKSSDDNSLQSVIKIYQEAAEDPHGIGAAADRRHPIGTVGFQIGAQCIDRVDGRFVTGMAPSANSHAERWLV